MFCYLAGIVVDKMGGSYYGVYMMTLIFGGIALICTILLTILVRRESRKEEAERTN